MIFGNTTREQTPGRRKPTSVELPDIFLEDCLAGEVRQIVRAIPDGSMLNPAFPAAVAGIFTVWSQPLDAFWYTVPRDALRRPVRAQRHHRGV